MAASGRKHAESDFRRGHIRAAALAVLRRKGVDGLTMRAVADAADYTPGALYSYYPGKDDLLADLLADRLKDLTRTLKPDGTDLRRDIGQWAGGLYDGLTADGAVADLFLAVSAAPDKPETPTAKALNGQTIVLLRQLADTLRHHGIGGAAAEAETVRLYATIAGLVLLARGGTMAMVGRDSASLLEDAVETLYKRLRDSIS
jgi:AcrR family transcriptional regulator